MLERDIQRLIHLALSKLGAVIFRLNTGQGWTGDAQRVGPSRVLIENARPMHSGLVRGGSDLVGWFSVVITPEMVGRRVAVFAACEVKRPGGRATAEQLNFLEQLRSAGGIAVLARTVEDATGAFRGWIQTKP